MPQITVDEPRNRAPKDAAIVAREFGIMVDGATDAIRVITDLDMIYISGPGHGGPTVVASTYLEGTYSEIYPNISQDEAGLRKLFLQFSFPGGIPGHASPECPGSIHEGGELGYSAEPCVRGGVRQSRSRRRLCHWLW